MKTPFLLLHSNNFNINEKLNIISVSSLTKKWKNYLYTKIYQHIKDPYKDIYFSKSK